MKQTDGASILNKRPASRRTPSEQTTPSSHAQSDSDSAGSDSSGIVQRPKHSVDVLQNGKEKPVSLRMDPGSEEVQVSVVPRSSSLSLQQLFLLNMVVCGLEFCASAAFTYIPPMLLKAGIEEEHMSLILGIGPLLGFLFVPAIGSASDTCRSRYGRRRPFILGLGCLLIFSLMIIPYGELVATYFIGKSATSQTVGIGMLIIGSVLLDFTSQAGLTPCEALLSDASRHTTQQDRAFTVYSFMVSAGGCIGYLITALDWSNNSVGLYFGGQEQSAFSLLIVLFTLTLFTTLLVADEKPVIIPPRQPSTGDDSDHAKRINQTLDQIHQALVRDKDKFGLGPSDPGYETASNQSFSDEYQNARLTNSAKDEEASAPLLVSAPKGAKGLGGQLEDSQPKKYLTLPLFNKKQCDIPLTRWTVTTFEGFVHFICMRLTKYLPRSFKTLSNVPAVLKRLALANYCSWTAVMGFNLFFTDFVGQAVYGGNPNAEEDSHERALYDEGVRMASWGLLFHCITSAIYATVVDRLVTRYSMRTLYCCGMLSFSVAMTGMVFLRNIYVVNLLAACTGFAYATVTTIPFMLVQNYHANKEIYFYDRVGARGTGTDMATLDSAYFLSQVMLTAFMGYIVYYSGTVLAYVVIAGSLGVVACMCTLRVIYTKQEMHTFIRTNRGHPQNSIEV